MNEALLVFLSNYPIWLVGAFFSLLAGLATALGAIPIFFTKKISIYWQDIFMGFGAGVMLAATSFSLIIPGLEAAGNGIKAALIIVTGIMFGGIFLYFSSKYLPHEHFFLKHGFNFHKKKLAMMWLFIFAITIHNFPEGLAVGVGFGNGDLLNGISLAIGIGIQNIPEGLVVALALLANGFTPWKAFLIALLTGLVEPIGGLLGAGAVSIFNVLLPWGLAFAAGAMLYVISAEIIPESHRKGFVHAPTIGLMLGFVLMLFLDVALG
ncbi:ZIP family metal transporter [Candidatus Woesearchaeota archaeon]|nr:ZIP family metal transporter [Candidatus Woesearchaeota archaeon]